MSQYENILKEIYELGNQFVEQEIDKHNWDIHARENQKIPHSKWFIWLIMAGRGFGKTRTGSESIKRFVELGYKNICLLGKTKEEVRKVMIEGESGILSVYPNGLQPTFCSSKGVLTWQNGAKAQIHSSDSYESLRGPQFDLAWVDELAKFSNVSEVWDQLMMTMRLGIPKVIVTTTPKPIQLLYKLQKDANTICTFGSTLDNSENLSSDYLNYIQTQYGNTQFGDQEICGKLLEHVSLWSEKNIVYKQIDIAKVANIIIAVDPAITTNANSDETGILVLGKVDDIFYVLEDASGKLSNWPEVCSILCKKYKTNKIVAEINQGGDMVESLVKIHNPYVKFVGIRSMHSKVLRAQPVVCLYDQKKVYHIQCFHDLEKQMIEFPNTPKSPDRVDALVIGINYLKANNREFKCYIV
ncbi:MAG: DNA-packaging protein [Alphaproteobacteria bacterium]|nr:MAG: DNA-packaging protein [Alphaproteobacteria bacterium]